MSGYGLAVQQGVQMGATLMMGANSPEALAAYNTAYNTQVAKYNAQDAKIAAERNISAVLRDNMIQDVQIQLQQNTVEAQIRSQAAWAGAEGGSVDAVVYDTESAEIRRMADAQKKTEQSVSSLIGSVKAASTDLLAIQEYTQPSLGGSLLAAFSNYSAQDFKDLGVLGRGKPSTGATIDTSILSNNAGGQGVPMNFDFNSGESIA